MKIVLIIIRIIFNVMSLLATLSTGAGTGVDIVFGYLIIIKKILGSLIMGIYVILLKKIQNQTSYYYKYFCLVFFYIKKDYDSTFLIFNFSLSNSFIKIRNHYLLFILLSFFFNFLISISIIYTLFFLFSILLVWLIILSNCGFLSALNLFYNKLLFILVERTFYICFFGDLVLIETLYVSIPPFKLQHQVSSFNFFDLIGSHKQVGCISNEFVLKKGNFEIFSKSFLPVFEKTYIFRQPLSLHEEFKSLSWPGTQAGCVTTFPNILHSLKENKLIEYNQNYLNDGYYYHLSTKYPPRCLVNSSYQKALGEMTNTKELIGFVCHAQKENPGKCVKIQLAWGKNFCDFIDIHSNQKYEICSYNLQNFEQKLLLKLNKIDADSNLIITNFCNNYPKYIHDLVYNLNQKNNNRLFLVEAKEVQELCNILNMDFDFLKPQEFSKNYFHLVPQNQFLTPISELEKLLLRNKKC